MSKSVANTEFKNKLNKTSLNQELKKRKNSINPINERVKSLRDESLKSRVTISSERAKLLTEFYKTNKMDNVSSPVKRALAFKYLMENMNLPIEKNQLIVGIRGTDVKEVPTFPEICCHSLKDLEILSSREKNPYHVADETKLLYKKEIIPFWTDKNIRKKIFEKMSKEWILAYKSGVFTEFMEQRAPGHTAGDKKIFTTGLLDIKKEIQIRRKEANSDDKIEELKAMEIVADAMISYSHRYAEKLKTLYKKEKNPARKKELKQMIQICQWVPAHSPRTFWEALQHYWFVHVGVVTEVNPWDAFSPGRLDVHLYPFYKREISKKTLTREKAKELLELFWLKFNSQPAPPKVGVTAAESNTYNDFSKINIGGLTKEGKDAVNDLSFLILEILNDMRTLQPNTAAMISEKTSDEFLLSCIDTIKPGFGEPPLFNFDGVVKLLLRQDKTLKDSYESGCTGCVETGAFGKESYILTGYFNLPKVLEITLNNGLDPRTGKKVGLQTGESNNFKTFEDFFSAFKKQLRYFIDLKMKGNDIIEEIYARNLPVPFLSLWIDDCIEMAKDYNEGGARYNTQYIQFVGLGTITDSLGSIKFNVFESNKYSLDHIKEVLNDNYQNNEELRQIFINKTPKFGNDDDYVDIIAENVLNSCVEIVEGYENTPVRNASRRVYFLPTTVHVYFGEVCGATPDGRKAGLPVSEGISPVQGSDRKGIAGVIGSIGKLDHIKTGGTLLNQRLSPDLLESDEVKIKFGQLIRTHFKMGSHHIQFNVVSTDLLKKAQNNPMDFQDLMVRVAGYSDYFINLPKGLQNEIISRTEQNI
ncbi:MAG: glycyl radical protein [Thermoplasmatales archaeon]|nr:MAG: glycyl radical protein [Thermoplasmatales archaeon]